MIRQRTAAKINLSLLVGPTRPDGYHELLSVFAPVDLYDELEFALVAQPAQGEASLVRDAEAELVVVCPGCPGVAGDDNLVAKALRVVAAATGWTITGVVTIHKGIPLAAGLGGGSADAAVALGVGSRVVAEAGGPALEEQDLWRLARSLGADVPFFLDPRPAIGRGIGDLLEPLELPPVPGVLVAMTRELSTAEVFSTFEELFGGESAGHFADRAAALVECWETLSARWHGAQLDWDQMVDLLSRLLINDLEAASFHLLPELRDVKAALLAAGAAGALMSGSGPAVFGICRTEAEADHIAQVLQAGGLAARRVQLGGVGSAP